MFEIKKEYSKIEWERSYRQFKKKAMDQELSWTGLVLNLSIAFFIVAISAGCLNFIYNSIEAKNAQHIDEHRLIGIGALASVFIETTEAATLEVSAMPPKDTIYVSLLSGASATQKITLKNTGKISWKPSEVSFETGPYLKTFSKLKTSSWPKYYQPTNLSKEVKPGQSIEFSFPIKAPTDIEGMIQENFQLVKNEQPIPGSLVRVFVTISKTTATPAPISVPAPAPTPAPAPNVVVPPTSISTTVPVVPSTPITVLSNEPILRIGLFSPSGSQRVMYDSLFDVVAGTETLYSAVAAGQLVTLSYDPASRRYAVALASLSKTTASPVRFVPRQINSVATLLDYKNGPAWNPASSDNRFRNIIEYRYTEPAKKIWMINELSIETYLKGLAETTNASTVEFQKVMATAARSYAMYHYQRGISFGLIGASTKHAADHFHIDAYYDQVYRGYNSELRMPRLSAAVDATRAVTVSYQGKTVVTPYFSNSDGRTRDWTEVWGGTSVAWLKSVSVPQDKGKSLYGHGVGMSARGALLMVHEGKDWQTVLKYFYSGIELLKAY